MVHTDTMHVIHARAAGLDVHKMQITAAVRLPRPRLPRTFTPMPRRNAQTFISTRFRIAYGKNRGKING